MGLLDKKRSDGFSAPVEKIDLSAPQQRTQAYGAQPAPAAQMAPPEPEQPRYGINQTIELMRMLPMDNVELVVQVVKRTLESTHIRIDTIIQDATRKQTEVSGRISVLTKEIEELDREIATRRAEIARLDTDYQETTRVKDRLILAEKLTQGQSAVPTPIPATGSGGAVVGAPAQVSGASVPGKPAATGTYPRK